METVNEIVLGGQEYFRLEADGSLAIGYYSTKEEGSLMPSYYSLKENSREGELIWLTPEEVSSLVKFLTNIQNSETLESIG